VIKPAKGDKMTGICMDILSNLSKALNFDYEVYEVVDGKMGSLDDSGEWSGIVNELIEKVFGHYFLYSDGKVSKELLTGCVRIGLH